MKITHEEVNAFSEANVALGFKLDEYEIKHELVFTKIVMGNSIDMDSLRVAADKHGISPEEFMEMLRERVRGEG